MKDNRETVLAYETTEAQKKKNYNRETVLAYETTEAQTKKNYNRGTALEWSVGKLLVCVCVGGGGGGGVEGLNLFYSRETSHLSPDATPSSTIIQTERKQKTKWQL